MRLVQIDRPLLPVMRSWDATTDARQRITGHEFGGPHGEGDQPANRHRAMLNGSSLDYLFLLLRTYSRDGHRIQQSLENP